MVKISFTKSNLSEVGNSAKKYERKISRRGNEFLSMIDDAIKIIEKSKASLAFSLSRELVLELLDWLYEDDEDVHKKLIEKLETEVSQKNHLIPFGELEVGQFFNTGFDDLGIYLKINNNATENAKIIFAYKDDNENFLTSEVVVSFNSNTLIQRGKFKNE